MKDYTEIGDLAEVYLEDSWVLGVAAEPGVIRFDIDFVLTERHPSYGPPKPDEQYCYRRGSLVFEGVTDVNWTEQGAPPARDSTGEIDYGNIDAMTFENDGYELRGLWGKMTLSATTVRVDLPAGRNSPR